MVCFKCKTMLKVDHMSTINTACLYIKKNSNSEMCGINEPCKTLLTYYVNTTSKDKINNVRLYYIKYNIIYIYIYIYICIYLYVCM